MVTCTFHTRGRPHTCRRSGMGCRLDCRPIDHVCGTSRGGLVPLHTPPSMHTLDATQTPSGKHVGCPTRRASGTKSLPSPSYFMITRWLVNSSLGGRKHRIARGGTGLVVGLRFPRQVACSWGTVRHTPRPLGFCPLGTVRASAMNMLWLAIVCVGIYPPPLTPTLPLATLHLQGCWVQLCW